MRLVRQRTSTDCSIACVAMLAGVSYAQAKRVVPQGRTKTRAIKRALIELGVSHGYRTIPVSESLSELEQRLSFDALLKTRPDKAENWHWMVWDSKRKKTLDPLGTKRPRRPIHAYLRIGAG